MVISPHGLQMVEHAWGEIDTMVHASPDLADFATKMDGQLRLATGQTKPSFAALGISTTKGGAVFITADKKPVTIIPVGDRDLFLKVMHGTKGDKTDKLDKDTTCQVMSGNYVCVEDVAMFDQLGKGQLSIAAAGARGDIEFVGSIPLGRQPISFAGALQLARGAITVRGEVTGIPKQALAAMGEASKPRLDGDKTTGFGLAHLKSVFAALPMPDKAQQMFATLGDPLTFVTYSNKLDAQLPLLDSGPASMIVNACGDGPLGKLGAKAANGVCSFPIPNVASMMVALSIDGKTLHAGMTMPGNANSVELTGFGKELAEGSWQDAFWSHGSLLASDQNLAAQLAAMPTQMPLDLSVINSAIRAMTMLNEFGIAAKVDGDALRFVVGVRTAWSNPDDIVAKLLAIAPADVLAGKGPALAGPIATKGSPLENDLKAGYSGMMVPMGGIGAMAAVAIPAFAEYMKRSKVSGASLQLDKIGKNLKRVYAEEAAFPIGAAPLLPAGTCCGQPANKCAAASAAFAADPVWTKLDFSLNEPSIYQFQYQSLDGKTAKVLATGDSDCDGTMATYTLDATVDHGRVNVTITPPAPGVY